MKPFEVHVPSLIKVADLNPAAYNPRKIAPEKYEALKKNIIDEGFLEAIVVQKDGLRIIGGHQRARAVKELSIEAGVVPPEVPCIVLDIDDRRAKKLNIKLNNIQGEFEARMLGELLVDIFDEVQIDESEALDLGFALQEATKFIHIVEPEVAMPGETDPVTSFGRSPTLSLEFETAELRDAVKKHLLERADLEKKKIGDIVADALGLVKKKDTPSRKKRAV